ncbi:MULTISPECIES: fructose-6-phosphate aldolase [Parabacteroides]|uniref:fructose-6-phosphate aldolase n=1 Tax=Parabacteroides provencensis TaxID=1944636 RepID=UPI000C152B37|nr:fructose-6-phosphate aldolase [Parabacteroides provencensis]
MKFFIDTANLDQIREANELGVLDGVTTNPSLMAKEGIKGVVNQRKHYLQICEIVHGDVSAEVISTDFEGMVKEGEELASLHSNIVVKVPCIEDGIKAIKYFSERGIRTNCTLVFSVGQALLAAKAGATYVSPFVGRLDDIASDGIELVRKIVEMYTYYEYETQVLAASIRNTQHIIQCVEAGADVATCPLAAIKGLLKHPLTDSGLATFLADYKRVNG